jgi:hypothetical protein
VDPTCAHCGGALGAREGAGIATLPLAPSDSSASVPNTEAKSKEHELRGRLYHELDLLAFALEMEASEALGRGDEPAAVRAQQTRLGVRLAQRLVGGVPAPEVDRRLERWRRAYLSRFPG